jgi:hypothetical protein
LRSHTSRSSGRQKAPPLNSIVRSNRYAALATLPIEENMMLGKIRHYNHTRLNQHKSLCHHHCGLCKSLGKEYGLLSRFLLNKDVALLQEMLGSIDNTILDTHSETFGSYNCFKSPDKPLPVSFRYTSAISLFMAKLKIDDNIRDERGVRRLVFKFIRLLFAKKYNKALQYLDDIHFPVNEVNNHVDISYKYEMLSQVNDEASLDTVSAEYGAICGIVAEHGVFTLNQHYIKKDSYEFGDALGRLILIADSYLDLEVDSKKNAYNALEAVFGVDNASKLNQNQKNDLMLFIDQQLYAIDELIKKHPGANIDHLASRIRHNIELIFKPNRSQHSPSYLQNRIVEWKAFVGQVRFHVSQLPDNQYSLFELVLKKLSIISFCMVAVFILGCYQSNVPLSNKVNYGNAIVGSWRGCDESGESFIEINKLNDTEYLWIDHKADGGQEPRIVFVSEVNGMHFLNYEGMDDDGKKKEYIFMRIEAGKDKLKFQFVGNYLFKKGDLQFDNSDDLTDYFKRVMGSAYFYKSWDKEKKKVENQEVVEFCRVK